MRKAPIDPQTKTPGGLRKEHYLPRPSPAMRFWLRLDEELIGDTGESGCYHRSEAVNAMLTEYGILDFEERRSARWLLRQIGSGRAEALDEE